jgi:RNA polymerase sigma-70 factor (TIGR02960 family)
MPGDDSYVELVEPHRAELRAHCRRMLGSPDDADDALQETLSRAWKGLPRFEGHGSLRSWLYRIATNASLDVIDRRHPRVVPIDDGPRADPHDGPNETVEIRDKRPGTDTRYEQRESVELAFEVVQRLLPPRQRAVLVLREVLGYSAAETADALDTTVASVNSALQRARATIGKRLPERGQQETLRALGDERLRAAVERYVDAWERNDVEAMVSMLAEDACPSAASPRIPPVTRHGASGPGPSTSTGSRRRGEPVPGEELSDPGDPARSRTRASRLISRGNTRAGRSGAGAPQCPEPLPGRVKDRNRLAERWISSARPVTTDKAAIPSPNDRKARAT